MPPAWRPSKEKACIAVGYRGYHARRVSISMDVVAQTPKEFRTEPFHSPTMIRNESLDGGVYFIYGEGVGIRWIRDRVIATVISQVPYEYISQMSHGGNRYKIRDFPAT